MDEPHLHLRRATFDAHGKPLAVTQLDEQASQEIKTEMLRRMAANQDPPLKTVVSAEVDENGDRKLILWFAKGATCWTLTVEPDRAREFAEEIIAHCDPPREGWNDGA